MMMSKLARIPTPAHRPWHPSLPAHRPCPIARFDLASSAGGQPVTTLFLNRAPYPVRVFHVDGGGVEVPVLSLRSGEHAEVSGLSTYAWRARTRGSALLLELSATPQAEEATGVTTVHVLECGA